MYRNDPRYEVKSAGTSRYAATRVNADALEWADTVIVMRPHHLQEINHDFPGALAKKEVHILDVDDYYDYMHPKLIAIITERMIAIGKGAPQQPPSPPTQPQP